MVRPCGFIDHNECTLCWGMLMVGGGRACVLWGQEVDFTVFAGNVKLL